ncbi:unnamed protein product [Bemisia tabaci]|uniref:K Homology domain-containing protein n=1 Tax=Bemisia tabaci TaxID=7038 RepID=A0A9P0AEV6_BEMTA|nr:PREDICTED: RNA-binding protein Nova-1 [Bemisia tabaci]CAH0391668.1 unnamed protein product [Bemisia tabaci]
MDTCSSPENPDSRKRPRDPESENGVSKRSNYGGGKESQYHLKMLIPSLAAGAIIGKEGKTIAQLQKETGARVKMSKANDYYPGTSERVCIISGTADAIMTTVIFIMETIREKPELGGGKFGLESEREKQLKVLVPNSTAGMIIGKGGAYIKLIKEETGAYVQLSQKAKEGTLQERCITISGEIDANKRALELVLAKIMEDPQSSSCLNLSYAEVNGPVANFNPTGSPYANLSPTSPNSTAVIGGASGLNLTLNLSGPATTGHGLNAAVSVQLIEQIKNMLRATGYSEQATSQISSAMSTLARYGILGLGLGLGSAPVAPTGSFFDVAPMDATPAHTVGGVFGAIGTAPSNRGSIDLGKCLDTFRAASISPSISINNNSFGLGQIEAAKDVRKEEITVPELIVGAILGPGGRSLVEIQQQSGATIQISKKGTYAPGTQDRVVKIQGSPSAIASARFFINCRINEEEAKRNRYTVIQ